MRANLKGVPGIATQLASRILELHGEGTINDVKWSLAHVPNVPGVAKDLKKVPKAVGHVLEGVLKGVDDTAGKAFKELEGKRKSPERK